MSRSQADSLYTVKPSKANILLNPQKHFNQIDYAKSEYVHKTLKTLKICKLGLKTHSQIFDHSRLSLG